MAVGTGNGSWLGWVSYSQRRRAKISALATAAAANPQLYIEQRLSAISRLLVSLCEVDVVDEAFLARDGQKVEMGLDKSSGMWYNFNILANTNNW